MVRQAEVRDTASVLKVARRILPDFGKTVYWFRGHARASWRLVPSVHRSFDASGEHNLLVRFRLSAPSRHAHCPANDDLAGWLCLMRHCGLPTRLLDWSESPLTALYFAVAHEKAVGDAHVWALRPGRLNASSCVRQDATLVLTVPVLRPMLDAAFHLGQPVDDVLAVVGFDVDLRMAVQQAGFTIHGDATPLDRRPGSDAYLFKFVIPQQARELMAEELWSLGIRRSLLFPDLANLAADLAGDARMIPGGRKTRTPNNEADEAQPSLVWRRSFAAYPRCCADLADVVIWPS